MEKTVIVAGITRSGLSLMMQMLHKGGFPCYGTYPAFEDYQVGQIDYHEARHKAIKLVDSHNQLPPPGDYYVIRMRRNLDQQIKSLMKFMRIMGVPVLGSDRRKLKRSVIRDYKKISAELRPELCRYHRL